MYLCVLVSFICFDGIPAFVDWLLIIEKSDLSNEIKQDSFQTVDVSVLLYGSTTRTLTKKHEKKSLMETTHECYVLF